MKPRRLLAVLRTREEVQEDLPGALVFAGAPPRPLVVHQQARCESPEGVEYQIRCGEEGYAERDQVARRLMIPLSSDDGEDRASLLAADRRTRSDDVLFIVVLGSDPLHWVFEQVDSRDGNANLVGALDDGFIWTIIASTDNGSLETQTLEEVGLGLDSTVDELRAMAVIMKPGQVLTPA